MNNSSTLNLNSENQEHVLGNLTEGHPDRKRLAQQMRNFAVDLPSIIEVMRHLEETESTERPKAMNI
ncbi:hypothetical protein [Alicyclobacillus sp. SO9]|uniref:hypothetical protein n=1 Tax=Alicyclobacillus sp. SO9 TaxID=2665646 RepID=UPI0018E8EEEE|nr:hypothetical protein [Alicyclobacillus sp. SO9]QQE78427.1 hypothetical protein GI364_21545 [Alicyclobacillus sp. SO9]